VHGAASAAPSPVRTQLAASTSVPSSSVPSNPASLSPSPTTLISDGNTYEDDFRRPNQHGFGGSTDTDGVTQFGWYGAADGTHSYDSITNDTAQFGFNGTTGPNFAFAGQAAYSGGDSLAEFSVSATGQVGFQIPFDVCGDGLCDYAARLNTNAGEIELGKRVNGNTNVIADAPFTAAAGTVYWMRANYAPASGTLKMKIWPAGTTEPGSWNLAKTDTGPLLSSNFTGVGSWSSAPTTATASVYCYAFNANPATPAQPCGTAT
jgi:hypothetical protein